MPPPHYIGAFDIDGTADTVLNIPNGTVLGTLFWNGTASSLVLVVGNNTILASEGAQNVSWQATAPENFSTFKFTSNTLTSFDYSGVGTNLTSLKQTFNHCSKLTSFTATSNLDFSANVTDFEHAWYNCGFTSFPLIDTSSASNMESAWAECSNLTSFPLLDTSNVIDMQSSWSECSNLTSFPILDTAKVQYFTNSWKNCSKLTSFPLLDTSSGKSFSGTWWNCTELMCIEGVNSANAFISGTPTFDNTPKLCSPNLSEQAQITATPGINWTKTRICPPGSILGAIPACNVRIGTTTSEGYVKDYKSWGELPPVIFLLELESPNVPTVTSTGGTLKIEEISPDVYEVSSREHITNFKVTNDPTKATLKLSSTVNSLNQSFAGNRFLVDFIVEPSAITSNVTTMRDTFNGCWAMSDFPMMDTSNVTDMTSTWRSCQAMGPTFPLIDTSSVTTASSIFDDCRALISFPLLDFSKVTFGSFMWRDCYSLTSFPVINLTSNNAWLGLWSGCSGLTSFPLLDSSNVSNTFYGFSETWKGCSGLTDFPQLDFSKSGSMEKTFQNCTGLLSLPNINSNGAVFFNSMLSGCTSLGCVKSIVSNAQYDSDGTRKTGMFSNTPALVQPDYTARLDLADKGGANWTNPNPCP